MPSLTDRFRAAVRSFQTPPPPQRGTFLRGEISFADPKRLFPGGYTTPYNPSVLVTRQGLRVFDQMRQDDQVKAALAFKQHAVMAAGWTISSPEEYPDDWEPTLCVDWMLKSLEGTLEDDLLEIMTALAYGYSVTEKVWGPVDEGPFAGKIGLKALKTRRPESFDFDVDPYGNIKPDGVLQRKTSYSPDRLPVTKFVIYSHDLEFSNIYGRSDLEAAFRHWWAKDNVLKWLVMLLEALGIPPVFAKYDPARYSPDQIDTLKDIVKDLQARSFGIIPSPGGSLPGQGPALEFWAPELAGQATRVFLPAIEYYDQAIARAILMPGLIGVSPETQVGSFARAKVNFDVFMLVVDKLRRELEERVMREQIIKPLVDLNYVVDDYPVFKFLPLTEDDRALILDKWLAAVGAGVVQRQSDDEIHIREMLEFPEKQEGQVIEEPQGNGEGNYPALGDVERLLRGGMRQQHQHPRTYIRYDRQTNYARIEMNLARIEDDGARRLRPLFAVVRDRLVQDMERHFPEKPQLVNDLEIRGLGDVQEALKEFVRSAYGLGEETIRTELPRTFQRISFAPTEALRWLSAKALTISGVLRDKLTNDAKQVLLNALKFGEPQAETLAKLRAVFEPYVGDPTLIRDNELVEPYRLETILRTNATEAFNQGRLTTADDPAVRSFLRGMMYSAVIDDRTTAVCFGPGTVVAGAQIRGAIKRWYSGPIVELLTSKGTALTVTPDHPILTPKGWVRAGTLHKGDNLVCSRDAQRVLASIEPNFDHIPSVIEDVAETPFAVETVCIRSNLHRYREHAKINVVRPDGLLTDRLNGSVLQPVTHRYLNGMGTTHTFLSRSRSLDFLREQETTTLAGSMSRLAVSAVLRGASLGHHQMVGFCLGPQSDSLPPQGRNRVGQTTVQSSRQTCRRLSGEIIPHKVGRQRAEVSRWQISATDEATQSRGGDTKLVRNLRDGFPGLITTEQIVNVKQRQFDGHVYNLETGLHWYFAAGDSRSFSDSAVCVHNCRFLDGKVFPMDEVELRRLAPPNHFNCRSILVPVTLDMQVDEADIITPSEVGRAEELSQVGFK